jgi:hypothetical protein
MKIVYVRETSGPARARSIELAAAGHCVVQEPVEDWAEHLKLVYRDPAGGSRCSAWLSTDRKTPQRRLRIRRYRVRGAVHANAQIFADLEVDDAYQIIHEHYAKLDDLLTGHDAQTIYLRASISTCMERIDTGSGGRMPSRGV